MHSIALACLHLIQKCWLLKIGVQNGCSMINKWHGSRAINASFWLVYSIVLANIYHSFCFKKENILPFYYFVCVIFCISAAQSAAGKAKRGGAAASYHPYSRWLVSELMTPDQRCYWRTLGGKACEFVRPELDGESDVLK